MAIPLPNNGQNNKKIQVGKHLFLNCLTKNLQHVNQIILPKLSPWQM